MDPKMHEAIVEQIERIEDGMTKAGFEPMTEQEIARTTQRIVAGVEGQRRQQAPPSQLVPDFAVEGGLINDSSGKATEEMRRRRYQVTP